jgi:hypothetical protein
MKKIGRLFRNLWKWWFDDDYKLQLIEARRTKRRFTKAKKLADKKSAADGRTYYVILGHKNRYEVLSGYDVQQLKRQGTFRRNMTIRDLLEASTYIATQNKKKS